MSSVHKSLSDFSHLEVKSAKGFKYGIVVSQWNAEITSPLLQGAIKGLLDNGAQEEDIEVIEVPGSYELISGSDLLLKTEKFDCAIAIGCVIQGETRHFDFICDAVGNGLANVSIKYSKPVIFGVLTTDNLTQAQERSGGKHGNKGEEAAITAIQMVNLQKNLIA